MINIVFKVSYLQIGKKGAAAAPFLFMTIESSQSVDSIVRFKNDLLCVGILKSGLHGDVLYLVVAQLQKSGPVLVEHLFQLIAVADYNPGEHLIHFL